MRDYETPTETVRKKGCVSCCVLPAALYSVTVVILGLLAGRALARRLPAVHRR
jgi:hypothetical protein